MTELHPAIKLADELIEARDKAAQGAWYYAGEAILSDTKGNPVVLSAFCGFLAESDEKFIMQGLTRQSPVIGFVCTAANTSRTIAEIAKVAIETLQNIKQVSTEEAGSDADECLIRLEEMARGKG